MRRLFSCGRSGGASCAHSPRGNLSKNGRAPVDWWRPAACEEKNAHGAYKSVRTPVSLSARNPRRSAVFGFGGDSGAIDLGRKEREGAFLHRRTDDVRRQERAGGN